MAGRRAVGSASPRTDAQRIAHRYVACPLAPRRRLRRDFQAAQAARILRVAPGPMRRGLRIATWHAVRQAPSLVDERMIEGRFPPARLLRAGGSERGGTTGDLACPEDRCAEDCVSQGGVPSEYLSHLEWQVGEQ